jgi:hypothetical protein
MARWRNPVIRTLIAGFILLMAAACSTNTVEVQEEEVAETASTPAVASSATPESMPYPWGQPLPPLVETPLDGAYVKTDPRPGTPFPCARCADYKPEPGEWTLILDRGVYRIAFPAKAWRSLGSYTISGDELRLFNDPVCPEEVGVYRWRLDGESLVLETVEDPCSIGLRGKNLAELPWQKS